MKKIGEVIVKLRKQRGLKQKELAKNLGISATYLSLVENSEQKPSVDLIAKIADFFDLPVTSIVYMALDIDKVKSKEQQKYFEAAKPIIDSLIDYLLSDNSKSRGKIPLDKIKHNLKRKKLLE
jgi:transcriptional regulator with XRE-family HTH domain